MSLRGVVLDELRKAGRIAMTGSRYFGTEGLYSDWDYYTGDMAVMKRAMELGFVDCKSSYTLDEFTTKVYWSEELRIHLQFTPHFDVRMLAHNVIREANLMRFVKGKVRERTVWRVTQAILLAQSHSAL